MVAQELITLCVSTTIRGVTTFPQTLARAGSSCSATLPMQLLTVTCSTLEVAQFAAGCLHGSGMTDFTYSLGRYCRTKGAHKSQPTGRGTRPL
jgi:hypothetical protein